MKKKAVLLAFVSVFLSTALSLGVVGLLRLQMAYASPYTDIDVDTAYNMITSGLYPNLVVLDVRTKTEYDYGHIYDAVWIPVSELETRIGELAGHENHEIIVYCAAGSRSVTASDILDSGGFTKVYNMLGGISAWQSAGYPIWIATVHNVNTAFNYDTIQAAIDAPQTLDGHTILVDAGIYYEHVTINKQISLIGENRSTTVIDGNGTGNVIDITANHVDVTGFTIRNGTNGIFINSSDDNIISGNIVTDNLQGIHLCAPCPCDPARENTITNNSIKNNDLGIARALCAMDNIIYRNNFINNTEQAYYHPYGSYSNVWDDGYVGNYWSDYTGRDTDGDFIGETPYIIDEDNKDNYPSMVPFQYGSLPIGCLLACLPPCIYGNIITYVNDVLPYSIMYYNISTGELTDTDIYETFHSLYENVIACPTMFLNNLSLYDISTGSITYLAYPYQFNDDDTNAWCYTWPARVISMYGDIIALRDHRGVWTYNITTSSIIANLTTGPLTERWGVSVYENTIAFSDGFIWYHDVSTNITTNTTVPGVYPSVYGNIIVFQDGLTIKHYNISSGQVTPVGTGEVPSLHGNIIVFSTNETSVSADLNGDGDMEDMVIRCYDMLTHTVTNTGKIGEYPSIYGNTIAFSLYEPMVDTDLNFDGDKDDYVLRYLSPDTAVINVTTSETVVVQSYSVSINATVENQGVITENFNVTAYYDDAPIETKTVTNLPSGEETTVTFTWNTTGVEKGEYTISAKANVVPGETDTTDNTKVDGTVTVIIPGHDVAIKGVSPSKTVAGQGYSLPIHVTAKNFGNFTETFNVTAYYNETNPIATKNITLTRGNSTTVTLTWNTTEIPKGNYTISATASPVPGETDTSDNTNTDGWVVVTIVGDVDGDGDVDVGDQRKMQNAMFTAPGDPDWDPNADVDCDDDVDVGDQRKQQLHMFETW